MAESGFKPSSTGPKPVFCPQHLNSSTTATGWLENVSRILYLKSYIILQGESEERGSAFPGRKMAYCQCHHCEREDEKARQGIALRFTFKGFSRQKL